jgi:hypothetical protein
MVNNPVKSPPRALTEFLCLVASRGVVSDVLGQCDSLARSRVDVEHQPRSVFTTCSA